MYVQKRTELNFGFPIKTLEIVFFFLAVLKFCCDGGANRLFEATKTTKYDKYQLYNTLIYLQWVVTVNTLFYYY